MYFSHKVSCKMTWRFIFLKIENYRHEREDNQEVFIISSNERLTSTGTNSVFILITELNHPITGEIDEKKRCFARHCLQSLKKGVFFIQGLNTVVRF